MFTIVPAGENHAAVVYRSSTYVEVIRVMGLGFTESIQQAILLQAMIQHGRRVLIRMRSSS